MSLWRSRHPEPFEADDLTPAQELASRAAVSIDNARRFTQQQTASTLQRTLLPRTVPHQPAVEVAPRYLPASTAPGPGGDWFGLQLRLMARREPAGHRAQRVPQALGRSSS